MAQDTVLVLGADGFIGRHIAFGLRAAGWRVIAHARHPARLAAMGFETLQADLARPEALDPDFWRLRLSGVTHLVNAAGVLTAPPAWYHAIHAAAPDTLYQSLPAGTQGILISAVGIDHADTDFARYRREGEAVALRHGLTVLRAGLVLGETSYGGSSLARALAALPLVTPVVGRGAQRFNPIHAADLTRALDHLLRVPPATPGPHDIGGPEVVTQAEMLQHLRGWLGLTPRPLLRLPLPLARAMGALGDAMRLGPISRTAVDQLELGVEAKPSLPLPEPPRGFTTFLHARPAGTQDLWHARLYLMRPALRLVLAFLWIASGLIGLTLPATDVLPLIPDNPLPDMALIALARLGGLADIAIALALLSGWRPRAVAGVQAAVIAGYTLAFTALAPALWLLPLGGVLKNIPLLALLALSAILEEER